MLPPDDLTMPTTTAEVASTSHEMLQTPEAPTSLKRLPTGDLLLYPRPQRHLTIAEKVARMKALTSEVRDHSIALTNIRNQLHHLQGEIQSELEVEKQEQEAKRSRKFSSVYYFNLVASNYFNLCFVEQLEDELLEI
jgi:hypothetical protein